MCRDGFFIAIFFDFKLVAGTYWLTFVMNLAWAAFGFLLNGEKADFETKAPHGQKPPTVPDNDATRIL